MYKGAVNAKINSRVVPLFVLHSNVLIAYLRVATTETKTLHFDELRANLQICPMLLKNSVRPNK